MATDILGSAVLVAIVIVGLLAALGVSSAAFGRDTALDDPRAGLTRWR